jgi:hypothetical protein
MGAPQTLPEPVLQPAGQTSHEKDL